MGIFTFQSDPLKSGEGFFGEICIFFPRKYPKDKRIKLSGIAFETQLSLFIYCEAQARVRQETARDGP